MADLKERNTNVGLTLITILTVLFCFTAKAQIINTFAGNGVGGYIGNGGQATNAELYWPNGIVFDAYGNLYIGDSNNSVIRKVSAAGIITTIAGNGTSGFSGDGGQALNAEFNFPRELVFDASGNLYIADAENNRIRKINTAGVINTIAGHSSLVGYSGDGGQATLADLSTPLGLAIDDTGNLFFSDQGNHVVRKLNTAGIITTVVGIGTFGYSGDGGAASLATLGWPRGLVLDATGNLYIADEGNQIRKVNTAGIITTVAGGATAGYSGDGGQATAAKLSGPIDIAVDNINNVYFVDNYNNRVRKVNAFGIISTIAGNGSQGSSSDGGVATNAALNGPYGVCLDGSGNVYISDLSNNKIRVITTCTSSIISLSVAATNSTICAGQTTTLTASGANNYSWNTGATSATISVTPTSTTKYIVTSTDSIGCQSSDTITIVVNPTPTIAIHESSALLCIGNGLAVANTLIASGANTYTWSTGAITATITPSPTVTTTYTVTGIGTNGCINTDTIRVTVDSVPNVTAHLTSTFTTICSGDSIILKATGANTYTWTSISYTVTAADSIINGIKFTPMAGTDTFSVKGKDTITGCVNTATISVVVLPSPNIMVTPNSATICPGGSTTFAATGAVSYTWTPSTTLSPSINSASVTVSPTVTTLYLVSGTGTNTCQSGAPAIVIIPQDSIIVNSALICLSNSVTLNASSIATTYTWSPATGLSSTSGSSVIANPRNTTVYTISGTDAFGCMGVNTATVTVDSLPIISISKTPTITCSGKPVVLMASGASTYTWSTGTVGVTNTVSPTTNTEYTVVGTDTNGCSNTATQILLVNPLPPVAINAGVTSVTLNLGQSITLNASGALTYSWTSGNVSCDSCASNTESPVASTQYCVAGKDINGCRDSVCLHLVVEDVCDVFIPDAFSPNGDGHNDQFKVYGKCITELTLQVFDRWGNQVFTGSDPSAAWDGSYGGNLMNTGTYIYQVQYTLSNGTKTKTKGNFSLMR